MLLMSAVGDSKITFDSNGNEGLDKSRAMGRIDALSAAVVAAGFVAPYMDKPERKLRSFTL